MDNTVNFFFFFFKLSLVGVHRCLYQKNRFFFTLFYIFYRSFTEIKQLVTYPPEGRYRITINTEDYICLGQDQFLNDVIIDFYLTYLTENLPVQQRNKIHVFSTFFYRRLTTKPLKASRYVVNIFKRIKKFSEKSCFFN